MFCCFASIAKRLPFCFWPRLGCVTFFVYVLGLFSSPLGAPKVPLRTPANDHFLPRLSSDLDGVWLFRIHCQAAAVVRLWLRTGALFFSFRGSKGASSHPCEWPFFASPELGFRWCFAVSHPLPRGCRFAFVQGEVASRFLSRLRHVFCLRTGALFFSFRGSKGATSHPCEWPFFASLSSDLGGVLLFRIHCQEAAVLRLTKGFQRCHFAPLRMTIFCFASLELGFRWCFAVSHPLPRGCRFAFVQARLRHVFCLRTGALFFSFRGSKGATSHPCEWPFFASPELGFRWCLAVSDPLPSGCRCAFVATYWGSFLFLYRGSKGATSHPCEWLFFASPELGFRWCFAVSHPLPRGCRFDLHTKWCFTQRCCQEGASTHLKIIHPGMLYSLLSSTVTAGNFRANIEDRPRQRHYERLAPTSP